MAARGGGQAMGKIDCRAGTSRSVSARWFHRYGLITVFIPAMFPIIPLPLKVFVISAGVLHTRFSRFLAVILLARVIRYFGEAYIGHSTWRECAALPASTTRSPLSAWRWAWRLRWYLAIKLNDRRAGRYNTLDARRRGTVRHPPCRSESQLWKTRRNSPR